MLDGVHVSLRVDPSAFCRELRLAAPEASPAFEAFATALTTDAHFNRDHQGWALAHTGPTAKGGVLRLYVEVRRGETEPTTVPCADCQTPIPYDARYNPNRCFPCAVKAGQPHA